MKTRLLYIALFLLLSAAFASPLEAALEEHTPTDEEIKLAMYMSVAQRYHIPWTIIAAIDQYERTIASARRIEVAADRLTAIQIPGNQWGGGMNPEPNDVHPSSISWFGGIGRDGNGDGLADRENDLDVLETLAYHLSSTGTGPNDWAYAVWDWYESDRAVTRIQQFRHIYENVQTLDLQKHAFPVPTRGVNYSYRSTWGYSRGWGGSRIHEGTDIYANYGVPIRSVSYGVVEMKGWNPYGGWRIGVRTINNIYTYFAHMSGFEPTIEVGDFVEPGQTLGWVGSSGYGKPGTQGKFPPHLHFGLYQDNGSFDHAFDPYPSLRRWERLAKQKINS